MRYLLLAAVLQAALAAGACSGVDQEYVEGEVQPLRGDVAELRREAEAQEGELASAVESLRAADAASAREVESRIEGLASAEARAGERRAAAEEASAAAAEAFEERLQRLEADRDRLAQELATERARVAVLRTELEDVSEGLAPYVEERMGVYYYALLNGLCAVLPDDVKVWVCERDPNGGWRFRTRR